MIEDRTTHWISNAPGMCTGIRWRTEQGQGRDEMNPGNERRAHGVQPSGRPSEGLPPGWTP